MSYPPNQGYPPQQPGYGYPPQQGGYPPQQGGYPPQQGGYPPQQGGYPPQQGGYPPQSAGYPPQQGGYPPQAPGGYPPSGGQSGGIGFENLQQPPAQSYGGGAGGYPPQQPPSAGGYGAPPPPAQYYPPPQGGAPPAPYGAPPSGYPPATAPYGAPPPPQQPGYPGAVPTPAAAGYGHQPPAHAQASAPYGAAPKRPAAPPGGHQAAGYGQQAGYGAPPGANSYQASVHKATKAMAAVQIKTHGSVKPYPHFNAEQDAQVLRKAMKGMGTDEKAITNVIGYRTNKQRQDIKTAYKQAYGRDLIKDIKSEVSGNYERLLVGLLTKPAEYDAYCLHKAMAGAGTDEAVLIEILASRSNAEIREIKEVYKRDYKKVLEKELQSETSGHFKRLLVSLNNAARDESGHVDQQKASTDANNLYRAGEKKWGTDEAAFNLVMASRSHQQLRATFQAYHQISNRDIVKSLEGEFSGYILKGMLAIVGVSRDPPSFFATQFYKSMKGLGTNDDDLIRAAVTRSEVDMEEIKQRFVQMYKQPLAKFISDDVSGDYKKLLLAVVGQ